MPFATATSTIWSLAAVKAMIVTAVDTDEINGKLVRIADGVSAMLEKECGGRYFVSREFIEITDGEGSSTLFLQKTPVATFTSLSIIRYPNATAETIEATNYTVNKRTGKVYAHSDVFNVGTANVTATYTPGYGAQDSAAIPRDIWQAGLDLVKMLFDENRVGATGATQIAIGPQTFIIKPFWPDHIKKAILNNRMPGI